MAFSTEVHTLSIPLEYYLDQYNVEPAPNICCALHIYPQPGVTPLELEAEVRTIGIDPANLPVQPHPAGSRYVDPWGSKYQGYLDRWRIVHWGDFNFLETYDDDGEMNGWLVRLTYLVRFTWIENRSFMPEQAATVMEQIVSEREQYVLNVVRIACICIDGTPYVLQPPDGWRDMDYRRRGPEFLPPHPWPRSVPQNQNTTLEEEWSIPDENRHGRTLRGLL